MRIACEPRSWIWQGSVPMGRMDARVGLTLGLDEGCGGGESLTFEFWVRGREGFTVSPGMT